MRARRSDFRTPAFRAILDAMLARQLAAALFAVLAAAGCGKQLNPAFCDDHPNDPDCRNSGLVLIDAPMGECRESAQCAMSPNGSVCDEQSQTCVQCIVGVDTSACTGATQQCGEDNTCHGCTLDSHCPDSGVCLPDGQCADASSILYAAPAATGTCTRAAPCTFTTAVQMVSAAQHIIKLTTDAGAVYSEPPIALSTTQPVQILGEGATFQPSADGAAIEVSAGNVEIIGLAVKSAKSDEEQGRGDGVACSGTAILALRRMMITDNAAYGVASNGCTLTVERSRLSRNPSGAMLVSAGTIEIRNNIVDHNGNPELSNGNISITNAAGRVVFNTIVQNLSKGGKDRVGGVDCSKATGQEVVVRRNIISANGDAAPIGGNCVPGMDKTNYTDKDINKVKFANLTDYKLTDMSPGTILLDDPEANPDCMHNGKFIDDYEGQPRPANYCDRGADEYRP